MTDVVLIHNFPVTASRNGEKLYAGVSCLSFYKTETLEVYLLLLAALVGDAQFGCCHAAKFVACVDDWVVLAVV